MNNFTRFWGNSLEPQGAQRRKNSKLCDLLCGLGVLWGECCPKRNTYLHNVTNLEAVKVESDLPFQILFLPVHP